MNLPSRIMLFLIIFLFPYMGYAKSVTFDCRLTSASTYVNEKGKIKQEQTNEKMNFQLLVDTDTKKAYMLGDNGSTPVECLVTSSQIFFVEKTSTGNITTTSLFMQDDGGCVVIHSRHMEVLGGILASQYYGTCTDMYVQIN